VLDLVSSDVRFLAQHLIYNSLIAGLSGFAIFVSVTLLLLSVFCLMVPVIYDKYDRLIRLARALQEIRVAFILATAGLIWSLLIR
jgi:uncharacterized membrane protein YqjE